MSKFKQNENITLESLDFLLKDILEQIKFIDQENKEAAYTKLIELFFKGMDLKEKISGAVQTSNTPQINIIKGIDKDLI